MSFLFYEKQLRCIRQLSGRSSLTDLTCLCLFPCCCFAYCNWCAKTVNEQIQECKSLAARMVVAKALREVLKHGETRKDAVVTSLALATTCSLQD